MINVLKKLIACICIILVLLNFMMHTASFAAVEAFKSDEFSEEKSNVIGNAISGGLTGILASLISTIVMGAASAIQTAGLGVARLGGVAATASSKTGICLSLDDILFNKLNLTNIDFFNTTEATLTDTMVTIREQIALWYYVMRVIAIVILLIILIFVGIRMAITTVATEKAIYKKALFDWFTSLALVFLLHYIISAIIWINNVLVGVFASVGGIVGMEDLLESLWKLAWDGNALTRFTAAGMYVMLTVMSLMFLINYIKRMLVLAFLTIISPLITITYSVDKMGDQKAQALNSWFKEFSYNVLIQPFHCILYIVFANIALKTASSSTSGGLGALLLSILCIKFVFDGEKIVRKIFGFEQASSLAAAAASGAVIGSALNKAVSAGKAASSGVKYANNSKTGQLLKEKWNNRKDTKLKDKAASQLKEGATYDSLNAQQKKSVDRRVEEMKKNKGKTPIRKMKEEREYKKLKEKYKDKNFSEASLRDMASKNIDKKPKGKIKGWMENNEFAKALGTDAKRFARRVVTPENVAKLSAGIFAGAAMYALPEQNLVSAVAGGYTASKAAGNKVKEIRNRKSENYEDDLIQACNANSYATGVDMTDENNRNNYMDTVMAEGKNGNYSQDNINKVEKAVAEKLEQQSTKLGINPEEINALLAKIKRDLLTGEGYSAKTLEGYGADPNELNKIVGQFAAIVNNSLLFTKTDAFDTQMEPAGYDHDDVMNGIDTSKLHTNNKEEELEEKTVEFVKNNVDETTTFETLQTDASQKEDEAKQAFRDSVSEFERTLDAADVAKFDNTKLLNELEEIVRDAMDGGIKDIEKKVDQTLKSFDITGVAGEQIKEKVIEYKEVREIRENIINNKEKVEKIIENIR